MPSSLSRTIAWFSLGGFFCVGMMGIGLWGPESGLLQAAHRAEVDRLMQAFSSPLARGIANNDDLVRIDELRRLQKLPGVVSARVNEKGRLEIRVLKTPWRLWRYRWLERALSLGILFVLAAGTLGVFWNHSQQRHRMRVIRMLKREHHRMEKRCRMEQARHDFMHKRWMAQAMDYTSQGLVMLDENQRLVMANAAAMEHFQLTGKVLGTHWLDHTGSPEWATALRRSLENPGVSTPGPDTNDSQPAILRTFSKPEDSMPESTWIAVVS